MHAYSMRSQALATSLAALAGFVDASGFILLHGFFVSFMSGNSTRFGVGLVTRSGAAAMSATLLVTFVVGVIVGMLVGRLGESRRAVAVLGLVATLLGLAAHLGGGGHRALAGVVMSLAMGAENAVFEVDGEVRIGLTYMTGTLVKFGQRIAAALLGGDPFGWTPYLILWTGLAAGGLAGAFAYSTIGVGALWIAAAVATVLALVSGLISPDTPSARSTPRV